MKKGFTLIELILTTALMAIVGFWILSFQSDVFSYSSFFQSALNSQIESSRAFNMMIEEIRTATYANTGSYVIAHAETSTLTFYSDVDGDEVSEKIKYYTEDGVFKRSVIEPELSTTPITYDKSERIITLISKISNTSTPIFTYYTKDYDGTTSSPPLSYPLDTNQIRLIKINLEIVTTDNRGNKIPSSIGTQVSIRNLKDNL